MRFLMDSACGCNIGKYRANNEDNYCFNESCLEVENDGLIQPISAEKTPLMGKCVAVFDGMGGENFGEYAAYAAARELCGQVHKVQRLRIGKKQNLLKLTKRLNQRVVNSKREMHTTRMGTTMVMLCFDSRYAYVCNIGDSRAYRLRAGKLKQLSQDHVQFRPNGSGGKAPLTQHFGIDPSDMRIEPYVDRYKIKSGDQFLLCSDGLTDMLDDEEICDIMCRNKDVVKCVNQMIQAALAHGGRDNITVILCKII